jgi:hypothetical protein
VLPMPRNYCSCGTGDCGSGNISCQAHRSTYPVTLLSFDIKQNVVSDEVSLVHGHNIAVRIQPDGGSLVGGSGSCPVVDCVQDISNIFLKKRKIHPVRVLQLCFSLFLLILLFRYGILNSPILVSFPRGFFDLWKHNSSST